MSAPALSPATPTSPSLSDSWRTPLELGGLAAVWGASFLFMRIAAKDFGALPLVEIRLVLGALVLLPLLWRARADLTLARWPMLVLVGAINSAVPFSLFAWAAQRAPAGVGAITNSMAALFTALVAFAFYGERIGPRRAIALVAGFAGVVVLASGKAAGASVGWAAAAGTTAAFLYGIGANLVRRKLAGLAPGAVASATLLCAAVLLLPFALLSWPEHAIPAKSWAAAAGLGVFCTGFAYAVFFRLIQRIGAARAVTVTYIVPLFGVAWAWLLLDEAVTPSLAIAGVLILGGVVLSQREKA
ncbi:DMT family transporter [Corallococcus sp. M34]|uniref:DMT family transporter n=1 Tax=Citreicoccus inhibens TaxID=2849499 RepID=UPI001C248D6D|nr:DMT family transporter [Citreicoccus inhibens]MBU8895464.1 DMT family transporter [Citreicoccus inhibens]